MKGAFLNSGTDNIRRVYSPDTVKRIEEHVDLIPGIINPENIPERSGEVEECRTAFSTWGMPQFSAEEIESFFPRLEIIFYGAGSVQRFARPFLERGITVVSAWGANGIPVAEFTASLIMLCNKGFFPVLSAYSRIGHRDGRNLSESFPGNYRTRIGIIGAGMIGTLVIKLLRNTDLEIVVYDPFLPDEKAAALGVSKVSLEELFETSSAVSNHLANLPETKGILNGEYFDRMPPNGVFINTGRGAQVVEADLIRALKKEPGRTAVLDVTDPEPVPPESELLNLPNAVITPHIAGSTGKEVQRMGFFMAEELLRFLNREPLRYSVTLEMLDRMA
jgi:phosphoglycerate dehydrogenase-like enzyme